MTNTRILIVEDEISEAIEIENRLCMMGYAVAAIASSGEDAFRKTTETCPDLVLMDIYLQGRIDGVEAAEEIHTCFDIPVVYLSAHDDDEILQRVKITEPFGYLLKPFSGRELHSTIEIALYKHKTEKKLKEREARFRSIVQDQTDLICRYLPDGTLTFVNEAYCRYFGKQPEELIGKCFLPLIHQEDQEKVEDTITSLNLENPVAEIIHRVILPDGSVRWQQWRNRIICDDQSRLVEYQATGQDITDRKQTEEALCESEKRYSSIFNAAIDAFLVVDSKGNIVDANPQACKMYGYHYKELTTLHRRDLMHHDYYHLLTPIEKALRTNDELYMESVDVRKDGTLFNVEVRGSPFEFEGKQLFLAAIRDITERKQAEEKLRLYHDHLEELVEERTIEFTRANKQLKKEIAEHKQTEEELRQLEKAVETMQLGVSITDMEGKIIYTNPAEAKMHGYQVEDLIGQDLGIFAPPNLRNPMTLEEIEERKNLIRESVNIKKKDGSVFPVRLISDIVKNAEGIPLAIVTICEDITERKQVEMELTAHRNHLEHLIEERTVEFQMANELLAQEISEHRQAETRLQGTAQRLQTIIETVGDGITLSNEAGYFEIFNSEMEKITGYTKEEVNRTHDFLTLLYPDPDERQKTIDGIHKIRQIGKDQDVETTIRAKDGTMKTLLVSTSTVPSQGGEYFLSAYHDITDRKHTEVELQKAKETAEEAQRAAEAANKAKSEFLANMSHELRTPLNAILGYTQILKPDKTLLEKQKSMIDVIHRSGEHLLLMINDILDLSKIEAQKSELILVNFHLPNFLRSIVDITQIRAQQRKIAFDYDCTPELPIGVYGDEKRLRQVLLNLLSNAVKFTEQGKVSFRVYELNEFNEFNEFSDPDHSQTHQLTNSTTHKLNNSQTQQLTNSSTHKLNNSQTHQLTNSSTHKLRFQVKDTGIGIPEHQLEDIFLPFHQVNERIAHTEGTGLGLAISRKLVRMMGGELYVESTVGQGSTFWFDIDLPEVPKKDSIPAEARTKERTVIGFAGKRRKILIADDEEANRIFLKEILSPLGFDTMEAVDGHDAIEKASECYPDLILMDLIMPGMDGFEATRQIRKLDTGNWILDTSDQQPASSIQQPATSNQHPASNDQHPASSIQHPASSIQHPASSHQPPVIIAVSASAFQQTRQASMENGCDDFVAKPIQVKELWEKLHIHLGVEWIYEHPTGAQEKDAALEDTEFVVPTQAEIHTLFKLAQKGYLRRILSQLDEIEQSDAQLLPFTAKIRQFAKSFKMDQMCTFLEQYVRRE